MSFVHVPSFQKVGRYCVRFVLDGCHVILTDLLCINVVATWAMALHGISVF